MDRNKFKISPPTREIHKQIKERVQSMIADRILNPLIIKTVMDEFEITEQRSIKYVIACREDHRESIVVFTQRLLEDRHNRSEIENIVGRHFRIKPVTVCKYLTKARKRLVEQTGKPKEEHIQDAYAFYVSVVRDKKQAMSDRLKAAGRIDKLLGLEAHYAYVRDTLIQTEKTKSGEQTLIREFAGEVSPEVELSMIKARAAIDQIKITMKEESFKKDDEKKLIEANIEDNNK